MKYLMWSRLATLFHIRSAPTAKRHCGEKAFSTYEEVYTTLSVAAGRPTYDQSKVTKGASDDDGILRLPPSLEGSLPEI